MKKHNRAHISIEFLDFFCFSFRKWRLSFIVKSSQYFYVALNVKTLRTDMQTIFIWINCYSPWLLLLDALLIRLKWRIKISCLLKCCNGFNHSSNGMRILLRLVLALAWIKMNTASVLCCGCRFLSKCWHWNFFQWIHNTVIVVVVFRICSTFFC